MNKIIDQNIKKECVTTQHCFAFLSESEIEQLANLLEEVDFTAGDTIVTEGEKVDSVFIILSGKAKVGHVLIENNSPVFNHIATLRSHDSIGLNETGFYSLSGIRTATVIAETDIVALRLSMPAFHGFALAYPHVNEAMRKSAQEFSQKS